MLILLRACDKGRSCAWGISGRNDKTAQPFVQLKPITARQYLIALIGTDNFEKIKDQVDPSLLKGLVCFNHFIKTVQDVNVFSMIQYIGTAAACKLKPGHELIDLCIPVVLDNSQISYIFVSVKNWKNKVDKSKWQKKCYKFSNFFKNNDINYKYLFILMSLREQNSSCIESYDVKYSDSDTTETHTVTHFKFSGLDIYKNLEIDMRCLKDLLHNDPDDPADTELYKDDACLMNFTGKI